MIRKGVASLTIVALSGAGLAMPPQQNIRDALAIESTPADNGCPARQIGNLDERTLGRARCAEAVVTLAGTPYPAGQDNPACIPGGRAPADAVEVKSNLDGALGSAAGGATAAMTAANPILGAVAGAVFAVGVGRIVENNTRFKYSQCATACVQLPANATNIQPVGWSGPFAGRNYTALCDFRESGFWRGRCDKPGNANWAKMEPITTAMRDNGKGQLVCSVAKHWTANINRTMGLRVHYDVPQSSTR